MNNVSNTSIKVPFSTNETKPPKSTNTPDRMKKRDISKTPEKKKLNISVDKSLEKSKLKANKSIIHTDSNSARKEEKNLNRNSTSRIKITKKNEDSVGKLKTDSPLRAKKEVTSIFKGPKNTDFFNNAPKENGKFSFNF